MQILGLENHFSDSVRRVQMQILTLKKWFSDSESLLSVKIPLPKKAIFLQCNPPRYVSEIFVSLLYSP